MTFYQIYYAMNKALNTALIAQGITCPIYKYGTVAEQAKYPYIQTTYRITKRQPNGSYASGTLLDFDYYMNFFTAAVNERSNDAALFVPYETARELIVSPDLAIFSYLTSVLNHDETPEFNFKSGVEIIQKGLIFHCQSVVSHVIKHTDKIAPTDELIEVVDGAINY